MLQEEQHPGTQAPGPRGLTLFGERPPSQGTGVEAKLEEDMGPAHGGAGDMRTGSFKGFCWTSLALSGKDKG